MRNKIFKLRVITPIAIAAIGVFYFLNLEKEPAAVSVESTGQVNSSVMTSSSSRVSKTELSATDSSATKIEQTDSAALTIREHRELTEWLRDRGYNSYSDRGAYESYSEETLSKLAKNGDLKAIGILIPKALAREDKEGAIRLMNTAIVYGSTVHIEKLTLFTVPDFTNDKSEEARKPAVLETLAVTELIAMRGDKSLSENAKSNFIKSYKRLYNEDVTLTEDDRKFINDRAQEMYDSFQNVRRSIGLGDFDNNTPGGVDKFFGSSK